MSVIYVCDRCDKQIGVLGDVQSITVNNASVMLCATCHAKVVKLLERKDELEAEAT